MSLKVDLTVKNYRCFPDTHPVRLAIRPGFTAFLGVNNSGKSSLLRFFYEFRRLFEALREPGSLFPAFSNRMGFSRQPTITDPAEMFSNVNTRDLTIELQVVEPRIVDGNTVPQRLTIIIPRGTESFSVNPPDNQVHVNRDNSRFVGQTLNITGGPSYAYTPYFEAVADFARSLYIGPFRNVIQMAGTEMYFDIQVGQQFVAQWHQLKAGDLRGGHYKILRLTEQLKQLFGYDQLEINASLSGRTLIVIANGKSYMLPEIGAGLSQFIVVLGHAVMGQYSFILIDEPELNLHPSLQLDFLTTLGSYASQGVMFSTHSIGLARAAADQIYSIRKMGQGQSEVAPYEATVRLAEFLGELSFHGYKELGFESVLLVEGPKDVKTVQQFLRALRRDHQVVLLHLGGNSLINGRCESQLQEIKRISHDVRALIDSERDNAGAALPRDRQEFADVCQRLEIPCCVLERRAIENYLSERAVKAVKGDAYRALGTYEALNSVSPAWSKEENWRIAREMSVEEWQDTDLGQFLDSI